MEYERLTKRNANGEAEAKKRLQEIRNDQTTTD